MGRIIKPELIRKPTRREFLKYVGIGAAAFGVPMLLKVREAQAAITRGAGPVSNSAGAATLTMTLTGTTIHRMVVIAVVWDNLSFGSMDISSITVGADSAALIAGSKVTIPAGDRMQIAYVADLSSGGDKLITVTMPGSGTYLAAMAMEYQGHNTASQPDGTGATATGSSGTATVDLTVAANSLIVSICESNSEEPTAGANYALWGTFPNLGLAQEVEDDVDAGGAGTVAANWTNPTFGAWGVCAAAFKVAGGGGGGGVPVRHRVTQQ